MKLSVVIPGRNEHPAATFTLQRIWDELEGVEFEWETILVDNLSTDRTGTFCKDRYWHAKGNHRILYYTEKGSCWGARNMGVKEAQGEVVVLFDAHVLVCPGFFHQLLATMDTTPEAAVVYSPIVWMGDSRVHTAYGYTLGPDNGHVWTKFWGSWTKQRKKATPYRIPMSGTAGVAIRNHHLKEIGGWPAPLSVYGGGEQWLAFLTWMMGKECLIDPSLYLYHLADKRSYHTENYIPTTDEALEVSVSDANFFNICFVSYALGGDKWWEHRVHWTLDEGNPHHWRDQYRARAVLLGDEAKRQAEPYRRWVVEHAKYTLDEVLDERPWERG